MLNPNRGRDKTKKSKKYNKNSPKSLSPYEIQESTKEFLHKKQKLLENGSFKDFLDVNLLNKSQKRTLSIYKNKNSISAGGLHPVFSRLKKQKYLSNQKTEENRGKNRIFSKNLKRIENIRKSVNEGLENNFFQEKPWVSNKDFVYVRRPRIGDNKYYFQRNKHTYFFSQDTSQRKYKD